jgi:biotin carboxylase
VLGVDLNGLALASALGWEIAPHMLAPVAQAGGGCIRFLVAPPGELRASSGLEDAFAVEGTKGIRLYRKPGHRFGPLRRGSDRAGAILAVGPSRDEALRQADRAATLIRFDTVPVEAPLQRV